MRQSSRGGKVSGDDYLPENVSFGDVSIDFTNMELVRAGKESRLTVTELNLLRYMLRNAGRVMAREEILASVKIKPAATEQAAPAETPKTVSAGEEASK